MFGKKKSFCYNDTICIDILCGILYNTEMLSQEDIRIITDIVSTQVSLGIAPLEERLERVEKKTEVLNDSFYAAYSWIALNRRDIGRIEDHVGFSPFKSNKSKFNPKVAEETEKYRKTNS